MMVLYYQLAIVKLAMLFSLSGKIQLTFAAYNPCADDSRFHFLAFQVVKEKHFGTLETCKSLGEFEFRLKEHYCEKGHVKAACPVTCESCSTCEDDKGFTWQINGKSVRCDYLTKNRKKMTIRRLKFCYPGSRYWSGGLFSNKCIRSCGLCTAVYSGEDSPVPSSAPTKAREPSETPSDSPSSKPSILPSVEPSPSVAPSTIAPTFYIEYNICPWKDRNPFKYYSEITGTNSKFIIKDGFSKIRTCSYISRRKIWKRRRSYCSVYEIMALCPQACGLCVGNNPSYEFDTEEGKKKCEYIYDEDELIQEGKYKEHCRGKYRIRENCSLACIPKGRLRQDETFKLKIPSALGVRG